MGCERKSFVQEPPRWAAEWPRVPSRETMRTMRTMRTLRALSAVLVLLCVALGPGAAGAGPPADATGIDATGKDDVTAELQALIDRVPDGGVVRLAPSGRYRIDGTLRVTGRRDLRLDGNGARLVARTEGGHDRSHLVVTGGSGIVIHDLEIVGANPFAGIGTRAYRADREGQHGIRLEGATDVELARLRISDVYGDFIYLGRSDDGHWTERVWIHDSFFTRNGRQGIAVTSGRDVVIERNTITDTRRATIDLEPNGRSGGAVNVHILDNLIGPGRLLFLAAVGRGPKSDVVVARNRLEGHTLNMIVRPGSSDRPAAFYVVDNTSDTPTTRSPMKFSRVDGLVVTGNKQPIKKAGVAAVDTRGVCGMVVERNKLGRSRLQVIGSQPPCGTPPDLTPPAAPNVAGRPVGGAVTPSPSTTVTPSPTTATTQPAPPPTAGGETGSGGRLLATAATVAIAALVIGAVISRRRATRRDVPRTPPPSMPR